jgi:ribosome-interacting GTPase 1
MAAPKGTDEHSKRLRLTWLKRRWRRGRRRGSLGDDPMPMSHRDLWHKIKREVKGKPPEEELRVLERYLADWPEFKGPYQEMRKKYERRIADLRRILKVQSSHTGQNDPFSVKKRGIAEVALIGLPNSGKSTLLNALTGAGATTADYPYTTLTPNVGMWNLGGFALELIDLPPVPEGALSEVHYAAGLREAVLNADLLCLCVSLEGDPRADLRALRERLNEIGVTPIFSSEGSSGPGDLGQPSGQVRGAVVVASRADLAGRDALQDLPSLVPGAPAFRHPMDEAERDGLLTALCGFLNKIVVFARDPKSPEEPLRYAVPAGATVLDLAVHIHQELAESARRAKVWGASAKFPGQEVGLDHALGSGDVVEIHSR